VPATVTVPAGAASATFSITARTVSVATTVNVSASYLGGSRTAPLTVNPTVISLSGLTAAPTSIASGASAAAR
jgi:hypothetical protein